MYKLFAEIRSVLLDFTGSTLGFQNPRSVCGGNVEECLVYHKLVEQIHLLRHQTTSPDLQRGPLPGIHGVIFGPYEWPKLKV